MVEGGFRGPNHRVFELGKVSIVNKWQTVGKPGFGQFEKRCGEETRSTSISVIEQREY